MNERSIFAAALDIADPTKRAKYLDEACRDHPQLRQHLNDLLAAEEKLGDFLVQPPIVPEATGHYQPISERPGAVIDAYKLMEQIGEGGFGLVFVAEQQQPIRRKVALKIIKPGMDTRDVIARFEAERQALALMDHPNIARVFDGGATESGRPYFVMELVKGVPLIDYCDQQQLTAGARLRLFLSVCQAVQHAHGKGIIHRDLKPSNILVAPHDGIPVVKVIDFGIAKAIGQQLTDKTIYTRFTQMVGTPLYMSPEQAEINALDVDIRSDVYSLGVVLYELLTGTTPFDRQRFQTAAYDEIRRIIKEEEPPKPSTRLSTMGEPLSKVSAQRKTEPAKLSALVKGELDWIVMKALEKDRARRYDTANGLARDVERYLNDEPVEACPPTAGYRLRKFARKHRHLLTTAAGFAALLLLGIAASTWQAVRATGLEAVANKNAVQAKENEHEAKQERDEAQQERDKAKALNDKLEEANTKLRAKEAELRNTIYVAHMNLAQRAWDLARVDRVEELLAQQRPDSGESDLRGFEWHYFNRLCHSELAIIQAKGNLFPGSIAYSPDGKRLAAPTGDNVAKVWDAQTGKELLTLEGHTQDVLQVIFSPDGKQLATASRDNTAKVWDAQTGKTVLTLQGLQGAKNDDDALYGVAFSPDGKRLAAAPPRDTGVGVRVWNAQTGAELFVVKGIAGSIAFSHDGKRLAGHSGENQLKVFDVQNGEELLCLKKKERDMAGGTVVINGPDGKMKITANGLGLALEFGNVVFSPDGKRLAAVTRATVGDSRLAGPGEITMWDAQTGEELLSLKGVRGEMVECVTFSADGKRLAGGPFLGAVKIWDAETGKELRTLKGHTSLVRGLVFRPDGKQLAALSWDRTIRVWDIQPLALGGESRGIADISFCPDGKLAATASLIPGAWIDEVKLWDAKTGRELRALKGLAGATSFAKVVFSADGKRVAGTMHSLAKVWDTETGKELVSIEDPRIEAWAAMSPDGKTLALAGRFRVGQGSAVTLWDTQTGRELLSCPGEGQISRPIAFSADGKRLFGQGRGGVIVWDTRTAEVVLQINNAGIISRVIGVSPVLALSGDGKRLAGYDNADRKLKVWDAETGKELLTLKGGQLQWVTTILFSPDGKRVVTASSGETETVQMWNAQTGEELLTLNGQAPLAFSPDGYRLFGRTGDGTLQVWDATPLPEEAKK